MKTRLRILKPTIILCGLFVATAVFGQNTWTWTAAGTAPTNLDQAANWSPSGGPPVPNNLDTMEFNGVTGIIPQILTIGNSGALGGSSGSTRGLTAWLTASQTALVQFGTRGGNNSGTIRMNGIQLDPGAGPFILGDNDNTHFLDIVWGGVAGQIQEFLNNSTSLATIMPNCYFRYGGGGNHNLYIDGTGNWQVNHYLVTVAGSGSSIYKVGTGTMWWYGTNASAITLNSVINSPVVFNEGTIVLQTSDLLNSQQIQNIGSDPVWLQYNTPTDSRLCNLSGAITGPISVSVFAGSLALSAASTFSGNVTNSGGELYANYPENAGNNGPLGEGNTITFNGGTLGYSAVNSFDYSSRFNTAAGQAYSIDVPANQLVQFATGLISTGGTLAKLGPGTLTLAGANTYGGLTTVSGGKLVFQGSKTGSGNISVADGAALGVTATGTAIAPATLTLGTASGCTLEFNNVNSTVNAPLAAGTLSSAGTIAININSGTLAVGQCYPLFTWTTGSALTVSLGTLNGYIGNLTIGPGNVLKLNITALTSIWTGANNGNWDTTTPNNWIQDGSPATFVNGGPVLFDDTSSRTNVTVNALVQPTTITVSSTNAYSITSSGGNNIGGSASLTKSGSGLLTLSGGANTYTGITTISGGTVSVGVLANGGSASDIGQAANTAGTLLLDGSTLQYTGSGASVNRLFTIGPNGATIDSSGTGALVFNNTGTLVASGSGARTLTLTGTDASGDTLAATLSDSSGGGATSLMKNGAGKWVLTGNNTYSGGTTINTGSLQIGNGSASGSLGTGSIVNNGALDFNRSGTLTVGAVSGTGSLTLNGGGTITLQGDNSYTGGTTINAGTLQIGSGGATGKLDANSPVTNNSSLLFNSTSTFTLNGVISGTGSVTMYGPGTLTLAATNTYSGTTTVSGSHSTLVIMGKNSAAATYLYNGALLVNGEIYSPTFAWGGNLGGTGVFYGPVTINSGGGLAPGASIGSVGTLTVNTNLIFGGRLVIDVNKSLSPSNDFVVVSGGLTNTGTGSPGMGTLSVSNLGPALAVGDKFTLFSKPMQNGAAVAVTGSGATWANHLAVDGSISVTAVSRPALNFTQSGNSLQFSWDTSFGAFRLQAQTNSLNVGFTTNWGDYPGGGTSPVTVPIGVTNGTVFFRLVSP